jgi:predicted amidohydrolase
MHPFSFAGEDKVLEAGETLGYVDMPGMRLGSSICYDLRFPELYAAMAPYCHAAICIANWPASRVAHWRALLVARAIENQMYMIGVNRIGQDGNGLQYEKSSLIVGPDGMIIDPVYSSLEMDVYAIDAAETMHYRESFPTIRDKRYALYQELFGANAC